MAVRGGYIHGTDPLAPLAIRELSPFLSNLGMLTRSIGTDRKDERAYDKQIAKTGEEVGNHLEGEGRTIWDWGNFGQLTACFYTFPFVSTGGIYSPELIWNSAGGRLGGVNWISSGGANLPFVFGRRNLLSASLCPQVGFASGAQATAAGCLPSKWTALAHVTPGVSERANKKSTSKKDIPAPQSGPYSCNFGGPISREYSDDASFVGSGCRFMDRSGCDAYKYE